MSLITTKENLYVKREYEEIKMRLGTIHNVLRQTYEKMVNVNKHTIREKIDHIGTKERALRKRYIIYIKYKLEPNKN